jgi:hypothetical protein
MQRLIQFRLVQPLVRAFRQHRPAAIALLTTGLVLTGSIALAQPAATGWLFNQQTTPNQITLNGVQYTGECAAGPFYPGLSGSFISQTTPPAPYTRVAIKNVTPGMAIDPAPYTDREYDERRPTSETAKMDFSSSHQKRRFAVLKGKNTFEYQIKRRDRILETGTFNAEILTSLRQEERTASWIRDKVCANSAVALEVCAAVRISFLMVGILTTTMVCSSTLTANAGTGQTREVAFAAEAVPTREEAIDSDTDRFLYRVNPELNGRKLRSDDDGYINEWKAIRKAVAQEMKPAVSNCAGDQYWELLNYDGINGLPSSRRRHSSPTFDHIADAIFYSRHPELVGTPLASDNSVLAREWSAIRRAIMVEQPCS